MTLFENFSFPVSRQQSIATNPPKDIKPEAAQNTQYYIYGIILGIIALAFLVFYFADQFYPEWGFPFIESWIAGTILSIIFALLLRNKISFALIFIVLLCYAISVIFFFTLSFFNINDISSVLLLFRKAWKPVGDGLSLLVCSIGKLGSSSRGEISDCSIGSEPTQETINSLEVRFEKRSSLTGGEEGEYSVPFTLVNPNIDETKDGKTINKDIKVVGLQIFASNEYYDISKKGRSDYVGEIVNFKGITLGTKSYNNEHEYTAKFDLLPKCEPIPGLKSSGLSSDYGIIWFLVKSKLLFEKKESYFGYIILPGSDNSELTDNNKKILSNFLENEKNYQFLAPGPLKTTLSVIPDNEIFMGSEDPLSLIINLENTVQFGSSAGTSIYIKSVELKQEFPNMDRSPFVIKNCRSPQGGTIEIRESEEGNSALYSISQNSINSEYLKEIKDGEVKTITCDIERRSLSNIQPQTLFLNVFVTYEFEESYKPKDLPALCTPASEGIENTQDTTAASTNINTANVGDFKIAWPGTQDPKCITSGFKTPRTFGSKEHEGIDIHSEIGTPVKSPFAGVIVETRYDGCGGNTILINHNNGFKSRFYHLDEFLVSVGIQVEKGQIVGKSGSTGKCSEGRHLHYELKDNSNKFVDPCDYFEQSENFCFVDGRYNCCPSTPNCRTI